MNSERISPAHSVDFNLVRQAIVDRNHTLWGNEISLTSMDTQALPQSAYNEALQRISARRNALSPAVSHTFLRINQAALMNEDLHKHIIQTAQSLEKTCIPLPSVSIIR